MTAVIGGTIEVLFTGGPTSLGQVKSGKVTAVAVTSDKRIPAMPEVPTAIEAGLPMVAGNWFSLMAPKGTPKQVVDYLQRQVATAISSADFKEAILARAAEPVGGMPADEFARVVTAETDRWREVFRAAGIKPE